MRILFIAQIELTSTEILETFIFDQYTKRMKESTDVWLSITLEKMKDSLISEF